MGKIELGKIAQNLWNFCHPRSNNNKNVFKIMTKTQYRESIVDIPPESPKCLFWGAPSWTDRCGLSYKFS